MKFPFFIIFFLSFLLFYQIFLVVIDISNNPISEMAVLFLPNALRRKNNPNFRGGFSLGVDLGDARTGVAIGKGFSSPRPHSVRCVKEMLLFYTCNIHSLSCLWMVRFWSSKGRNQKCGLSKLQKEKYVTNCKKIVGENWFMIYEPCGFLQEIDEFIIGLPRSFDGKETAQSNKVRSIAGRLAIRAAERFVVGGGSLKL